MRSELLQRESETITVSSKQSYRSVLLSFSDSTIVYLSTAIQHESVYRSGAKQSPGRD